MGVVRYVIGLSVAAVLAASPALAVYKERSDFGEPTALPAIPIPEELRNEERWFEHFAGEWRALNAHLSVNIGLMSIGPSEITYRHRLNKRWHAFPERYRVLRIDPEYLVLVVHYESYVRFEWSTQFVLLALRRDPRDGEPVLFYGYRDDKRLYFDLDLDNPDPLTRPADVYRRFLDTPRERGFFVPAVCEPPWCPWRFEPFVPYAPDN